MQINSHQECKGERTLVKQKDKWEDYVQINLKQLAFEGIIRQDNVAQCPVTDTDENSNQYGLTK